MKAQSFYSSMDRFRKQTGNRYQCYWQMIKDGKCIELHLDTTTHKLAMVQFYPDGNGYEIYDQQSN